MLVRRREFLGAVAAAVLVHGLDRLALGGEEAKAAEPEAPPPWFTAALAEMKATKSPGVAIVLPADKDARAALLAELQQLLRTPSFDAQVHLVEAIYVVVAGLHAGAKEGETLVLLDAGGKRVSASTTKVTAADFARTVRPLLRDGDGFATRAKAARTPEFEKALAELLGKDTAKSGAAAERLASDFAAIGPAVLAAHEAEADAEAKPRIAYVISRAFARRRGDVGAESERPLPFGTKWKVAPLPLEDPCPPCGRMMIAPRSRDTLEYLVKDAAANK
jgi:hypothetical protein